MPADWRSRNPLCDVTKSQDVACVADVKPLPEHRKRSPVRCNLSRMVRTVFFSELSQFMISSPLNSSESDRRGRCLTWMGLIKRSMESRVLELLGKMEIGSFPFWTLIWTVLGGIRAEIISLLDSKSIIQVSVSCATFLLNTSFSVYAFWSTERPFKYATEMQRIIMLW